MQPFAFVYLLRCADGSIYTGWTLDVMRRVRAHQAGRGAQYTRTRRPVKLIYHERLPSRRAAMRREAVIKRWRRPRKLALAKSKTTTHLKNSGLGSHAQRFGCDASSQSICESS